MENLVLPLFFGLQNREKSTQQTKKRKKQAWICFASQSTPSTLIDLSISSGGT
jgi:hypothetical protein